MCKKIRILDVSTGPTVRNRNANTFFLNSSVARRLFSRTYALAFLSLLDKGISLSNNYKILRPRSSINPVRRLNHEVLA
jgi:hypothetical protein